MPAGEMNFEQVLASVGTDRFLSGYWTKKPLYLKGEKGRFERVFPGPISIRYSFGIHHHSHSCAFFKRAAWSTCGDILTGRLAISD